MGAPWEAPGSLSFPQPQHTHWGAPFWGGAEGLEQAVGGDGERAGYLGKTAHVSVPTRGDWLKRGALHCTLPKISGSADGSSISFSRQPCFNGFCRAPGWLSLPPEPEASSGKAGRGAGRSCLSALPVAGPRTPSSLSLTSAGPGQSLPSSSPCSQTRSLPVSPRRALTSKGGK